VKALGRLKAVDARAPLEAAAQNEVREQVEHAALETLGAWGLPLH